MEESGSFLRTFEDAEGTEYTLGEIINEDLKDLEAAMRDFESVFENSPGTVRNAREIVRGYAGEIVVERTEQALSVNR